MCQIVYKYGTYKQRNGMQTVVDTNKIMSNEKNIEEGLDHKNVTMVTRK